MPYGDIFGIWKDTKEKKNSHGKFGTEISSTPKMSFKGVYPTWLYHLYGVVCVRLMMNPEPYPYSVFICTKVRTKTCDSFGWYLAIPRDVKDLLIIVLLGHPFMNAKALLWLNITQSFFWVLSKERNQ